jgi:hypothetical protein
MTEKPADWDDDFEWPFDSRRRIYLKFLGDPNPIVPALGLDVELPDPETVNEQTASQWLTTWKKDLKGRIADRCDESEDSDWAFLVSTEWSRVWFDLEEGIIVYFQIEQLPQALVLLDKLRAAGVPLYFPDGKPRISVRPCDLEEGLTPDVTSAIERAGFLTDRHRLRSVMLRPS